VLALKNIYNNLVKIKSKYCRNASIVGAFSVFLGQKLFRTKKNNHKSEKFLITNEQLIRKQSVISNPMRDSHLGI